VKAERATSRGVAPRPRGDAASAWLRLSAAADLLGISAATLRRWTDAGDVPAYRGQGGQRRYRREDIDRLAAAQQGGVVRSPVQGEHGVRPPVVLRVDEAALDATLQELSREAWRISRAGEVRAYVLEEGLLRERRRLRDGKTTGVHSAHPIDGSIWVREALLTRTPTQSGSRPGRDGSAGPGSDEVPPAGWSAAFPLIVRGVPAAMLEVRGVKKDSWPVLRAPLHEAVRRAATRLRRQAPPATRSLGLSTVTAAAMRLGAECSADAFCRAAAVELTLLTGCECCDIYRRAADGWNLVASLDSGGFDADWAGVSFHGDEFPLCAGALDAGKALVVASLDDPRLSAHERDDLARHGHACELWLPLVVGGDIVGALDLLDDVPRDFSECRDAVEACACVVAGFLDHALLEEKLEERNALLRDLVALGAESAAATDPTRLLTTVAQRLLEVLEATYCEIATIDDRGEMERLVSAGADPLREPGLDDAQSRELAGVRRTCVEEQRVVVVDDADDPLLSPADKTLFAAHGFTAQVCLPLLAGDDVIGVLDIFCARPQDLARSADFLRAVGQQLGQAWENARLRSELRCRNDELRMLVDAAIEFGSSLEYEEVLRKVARQVISSTGLPMCDIYWLEGDEIVLLLSEGTAQGSFGGLRYRLSEYPVLERVVRNGETVVIPDVLASPECSDAERRDADLWGYCSSVDVPLMAHGEVVGVLELLGDHPEEMRHRDFAVGLTHVAGQAVANARLHAEIQKRDRLRGVLLEISRSVNSTLDYDELMDVIAAQAAHALAASESMIYEWDRSRDEIVARAYWGDDPTGWGGRGARYPLDEHPDDREMLENGRTLCEYISDPDLHPCARESMERNNELSCLTVPLRAGGEVMGQLLLVESRHERHWTDTDIEIASLVADQAASAIRNAALYAQRDLDRRRLASLLEASKAVASALGLEEALSVVGKRAQETLNVGRFTTYEYDRRTDELVLRSHRGVERPGFDVGLRVPMSDRPSDRLVMNAGVPRQDSLSDPTTHPQCRASLEEWGEKSMLSVPLRRGGEMLGIMFLSEMDAERRFGAHEVELARALGDLAATAIHSARLQTGQRRNVRRTELLNEAARRMALSLDGQQIVSDGTAVLAEAVPFDLAIVVRLGADGEVSGVYAGDGRQSEPADAWRLPDELTAAMLEGVPVALPSGQLAPLGLDAFECAATAVTAVGLLGGGRLNGVLCLCGAEMEEPPPEHGELLVSFASHLSLALNNAALYEDIRRMHVANLGSLTSTLMAKDYYTVGHAGRVAAYAVMLARELGVPRDRLEALEEVAYLHDIGKIAVSDRVLLKPGRLTDQEWQLMRQHAGLSADILAPIFDDELVAAVRHHHERFDGGGYPDGLSDVQIPLLARILTVADSYDAMSSQRSYRRALPFAECLDELRACSGKQFDPPIVDAFVRVLERLRHLREIATAAAAAAALGIDAVVNARVRASGDEQSPDYARIAAVMKASMAAHPPVVSMNTNVRSGHNKVAAVVDVELHEDLWAPIGSELYAEDAELAVYEGRRLESVAVAVDEWGLWIAGYAPIVAASGEVAASVCASIPALEEQQASGRASAASQTFSSVLRGAVGRMSRSEVEAITDPLTGLYNHRYFHERLKELQDQSVSRRAPVSLLFCDLDRFKHVNDRRGHLAGDRALRRTAQVLQDAVRGADVAARYGGDEFALLLVETAADAARTVAERVRAGVAAEMTRAGYPGLTVSIGVATCPGDASLPQMLVELADRAMYEAKRRGRDTVVTASSQRSGG
jgi:diguanylate cyclase (GGDEF)-like protein/excisionase family DNA binding protein